MAAKKKQPQQNTNSKPRLVGVWNELIAGLPHVQVLHTAAQETHTMDGFTELAELAFKDDLTGLFNRRALETLLKNHSRKLRAQKNNPPKAANDNKAPTTLCQEERRDVQVNSSKTGALIFIDLNRFKAVNDTYGHAAGDFLLQAIAKKMSEVIHVRDTDIVARIGGDEFVIMMKDVDTTHLEQARKRIEKAISSVQILIDHNGTPIAIKASASVGAFLIDPHASVAANLNNADEAMYVEKQISRKNQPPSP